MGIKCEVSKQTSPAIFYSILDRFEHQLGRMRSYTNDIYVDVCKLKDISHPEDVSKDSEGPQDVVGKLIGLIDEMCSINDRLLESRDGLGELVG